MRKTHRNTGIDGREASTGKAFPIETPTGILKATLNTCMATVVAASDVVPRTPEMRARTSYAHPRQAGRCLLGMRKRLPMWKFFSFENM